MMALIPLFGIAGWSCSPIPDGYPGDGEVDFYVLGTYHEADFDTPISSEGVYGYVITAEEPTEELITVQFPSAEPGEYEVQLDPFYGGYVVAVQYLRNRGDEDCVSERGSITVAGNEDSVLWGEFDVMCCGFGCVNIHGRFGASYVE
jgi:hypothetical protein